MKDYVISIHVPAWGTTFGAMSKSFGFSISIHVPAWGTTCIAESEGRKINISIHVPAWGTTIPGIHSLPRQRFQSTFPRGERLFTVEQYGYAAKNIPLAEVTKILKIIAKGHNFTLHHFSLYHGAWRNDLFYVGKSSGITIGELSPDRKYISSLSFNMTGVNPID